MNYRFLLFFVSGLVATGVIGTTQAEVLVPREGIWQLHKGTSAPSNPSDAWRQPEFNDDAWSTGQTPAYYDNNSQYSGNFLLNDMRESYTTVFLRKQFQLADASSIQALELRAISDDGFVAWINGVEVLRFNVPDGELSFGSTAFNVSPEPSSYESYPLPDPTGYLQDGNNVIAIHALNTSSTSSDFLFDVELASFEPDLDPPVVVAVEPPPGAVSELTQITVTFSEPVTGVDALDLLVNQQSPYEVQGAENRYTFRLNQPGFGSVTIEWDRFHSIHDLAANPNPFDHEAPSATWQYELSDRVPPEVSQIFPSAGQTLRFLDQISVTFNEGVEGVDAADLLVNGDAALSVTGQGPGPYLFELPEVPAGAANLAWSNDHGIVDLAPVSNSFQGGSWNYTIDPQAELGTVVINEFLASNISGLRDLDGSAEDWIEIHNPGPEPVSLQGWSMTDDEDDPGKWSFPNVTLESGEYLVVFASGKNLSNPDPGNRLHTNFKLNPLGEYLGIYDGSLPRQVVSEFSLRYPEQRNDISYGRNSAGEFVYMRQSSPGSENVEGQLEGLLEPPHFSVRRGFINDPFNLVLTTPHPDAVIRYTTDGSTPNANTGQVYTEPLRIDQTTLFRAAAFAENYLPSTVETHTYLLGLTGSEMGLPVMSLVTDYENLWGRNGIMETSPRNTTKRGIAWERPVSVELLLHGGRQGFHEDSGLRIQGGDYVRGRYDPNGNLPFSKYSFRLYFRSDYGASKLEYPIIPEIPLQEFDKIVLRAGMNDHSNPFIVDELVRRLSSDMGMVASHGTFVNLFLNGEYQGYYNPTERIDDEFLRAWHGSTNAWDLMAQFGEVAEGDDTQWKSMTTFVVRGDFGSNSQYRRAESMLDMTNFVDYLLLNIYAGTGDWPHNNWRAAREKVPGAKFQFLVWDAEWAFGNLGRSVGVNVITQELDRDTEIANMFRKLKENPEFQLLFADRIQKHMFHGGALTDEHIKTRTLELRDAMSGALRRMNPSILTTWIPERRGIVFSHLKSANLWANDNVPVFNQHGGQVAPGFRLEMSSPSGTIYYTKDGSDPRVAYTGAVSESAVAYNPGRPVQIQQSVTINARTLDNGEWSALEQASFTPSSKGNPMRITEFMYHPIGPDALEFIELKNTGGTAVDLSGHQMDGVDFVFPNGFMVEPGAIVLLISDDDPTAFRNQYPGVTEDGTFGGSLSNAGEKLALLDPRGNIIHSVDYRDDSGWPQQADGGGFSLQLIHPEADPDAPAGWQASLSVGGSPGTENVLAETPAVQINEIMADNTSSVSNEDAFPDWIELHNRGAEPVDLSGWSLSDDENPRQFVFEPGTTLEAGGYLVVWADSRSDLPGLHTGFGLNRNGESLFLYDMDTNRVDAVTFGVMLSDLTLGRLNGEWDLNHPTPGEANSAAQTAAPSGLVINEWLSDSLPGQEDWLEIHNTDLELPVSLSGLYLSRSNAVSRIRTPSFLAPGGFLRLWADEGVGPNHLDFKLPADGEEIVLCDPFGNRVNRIVYRPQTEGVSMGRLPDGSDEFVSFPLTQSPGAPNYILDYEGAVLNELLARNQGLAVNGNRTPDWIELYNPTQAPFDLSGMGVALDLQNAGEWSFPAGTLLEPDNYLMIMCDAGSPVSMDPLEGFNLGRNLPGRGGEVYLLNSSLQIVDQVSYGLQIPNRSIGLNSSGFWTLLDEPTPGAMNSGQTSLAPFSVVRINEWMAALVNGDDWFELHNPENSPISIGGLYLTDDPSLSGRTNTTVKVLSYIAPKGYAVFQADGNRNAGADHVGFGLNQLGETIRIYHGSVLMDSVDFGIQREGVSSGRLPDGNGDIVFMESSASPGASNYLLLQEVVVQEWLPSANAPREGAVELLNTTAKSIDISGWYLSDDGANLKKYTIPDGTILAPFGTIVIYEHAYLDAMGSNTPFQWIAEEGGSLYLSMANELGQLSGYRAQWTLSPVENGTSFGTFNTSQGFVFAELTEPTFGVADPSSVEEFRSGTGAPNASPRVGPVIINEIHYNPPAGMDPGFQHEYIELHNISEEAVSLSDINAPHRTWRLEGGVEFEMPQGIVIPAGGFLVVVDFDAGGDLSAWNEFNDAYSLPAEVPVIGPFSGNLNNAGESVELSRPLSGHENYTLVEEVAYSDLQPWPVTADGQGDSLQRLISAGYANDPAMWGASQPNPGRPSALLEEDSDGDGLPDSWELAHGLNPADPGDADLDGDGDGSSNREEYWAGTDPLSKSSVFRIQIVENGNQRAAVFQPVPGKAYRVEYAEESPSGPWNVHRRIGASASPELVVLFDTAVDEISSQIFYRIVVSTDP